MPKPHLLPELQTTVPEARVVSRAWLNSQGFSAHVIDHYVRRGYLESVARGVYRRPGPPLRWQHVVLSLQDMGVCLHVGGRTALDLHGLSHFVPTGSQPAIDLYGSGFPNWLHRVTHDVLFVPHTLNLFKPSASDQDRTITALPWGPWEEPLNVATPERALMEVLAKVPTQESFEHADLLMQGMMRLSPNRLMELLERCTSVKVKRLFLWLAERHRFRWLTRVDRSRIDLGRGKRSLVKGGILDPTYLITVPRELVYE